MIVGITGAKGFIGKNLCKLLEKEGHKVEKFAGAVEVATDVESFVLDCDLVVHLAGVNRCDDDVELLETNVDGTLNVGVACLYYRKPMIFISSTYPHKSAYRASKKICEGALIQLKGNMDLQVAILKLPKVYGPGCKPHYNSFVSTILWSIAKEKPYKHLIESENAAIELVHVDTVTKTIEGLVDNFEHRVHTVKGVFYSFKDIIDSANTDDGNQFSEAKKWYIQNM